MKVQHVLLAAIMVVTSLCIFGCNDSSNEANSLMNVSYDPTREMYQNYNEAFVKYWEEKTGQVISIKQSHGGSGSQARSVIEGLEADVVTLACAYDINAISEKAGILPANWQTRFAHNSCPYSSTMIFLVRKGNPKNIHDWDDIIQPGIDVVVPNPKTSGAARWIYLAAWGYSMLKNDNSEDAAREFIAAMYKNVHSMETGARGSTIKFVQNEIGDVLITWENEALMNINGPDGGNFEIVVPSISILAEPPVTLVDTYTKKHETTQLAKAYLEYLYSEEGQRIVAQHYYRPSDPKILAEFADQFPEVEMFTIDEMFGGWNKAQERHFNDGGIFDQIYGM